MGQTLGVAVSGAIAAGAAGVVGPNFVANSRAGWLIVAGCGLGVLGLGMASTTRRARASAERVAEELTAPVPGRAGTQPAGA